GARQHLEGLAEMALAQLVLTRHVLILPGRQGADEAAAMDELAGDLLLLDQREDPVEGGAHIAIDADGPLETVPFDQLAEAMLERAADMGGVARTRALAGMPASNTATRRPARASVKAATRPV